MSDFDHTGNATPAPGYYNGDTLVDQELLASYSPPPLQKGVTLKPGQGILPLGTLLAYDIPSKQYIKTTNPALARGFLRRTTNTGADAQAQVFLGNIVQQGTLNLTLVSSANSGVTLAGLLGGRVDTIAGFFIF